MEIDDRILSEKAEAQSSEPGQFTISLEAMLSRLGKFQGTGPSWWLARFVQAAVAAGCVRLKVQRSGRLTFESCKLWSATQVYEALTHPEQPVDRWLEHLRRGLWACGWQSKLSWELRLDGEEIAFHQGQLSRKPRPTQIPALHVHTSLDRLALSALAHPCPMEVLWESSPIPSISTIRKDTLACNQTWQSPQVAVANGGPHLLHWVEDGVILESQPFGPHADGWSVWGYSDAGSLPRDASGYGLVKGPEFEQRSEQVQRELVRQVRELQAPPRSTRKLNPMLLALQVGGATLGAGWLLGDPGLGTLIAFFTGSIAGVAGLAGQDAPDSNQPTTELLRLKDSLNAWHGP